MRIVVGLGNPGSAYAHTRHNVGFEVVAELARRWGFRLGRARNGLRLAQGLIESQPTMLVQPHMYMNLSGAALARLQPPVTAAQLIVSHDDLDLECGRIRVKRGGGTAGHHGLDSIVEHFAPDFIRIRIGVGRPPRGEDGVDYVLSQFNSAERTLIDVAVARAADAVECIVRDGEATAMNRFNVRVSSLDAVPAPMGRK